MTHKTFDLDFNSITGDKDTDQARGLRLVLAVLEDDLLHLTAVAEDVYTDPRGFELALWELVVGLAGTLGNDWASRTDRETVIAGIQQTLTDNAAEGV
ncbi:hypothetical protein [Cryobacterium sp. HLT2-28]|uniref:hypothetical protein n=1 Tax=Cryobacterium sp. HLT2-28 TaxID=1259146 RepID=UPI00106A7205|nr:hypothetical protein [Cryobacterium sp. HLT2-28]TFB92780.1 hypothetical protein E3O48_13540 [Cryobacterium sp. HLT2-28]